MKDQDFMVNFEESYECFMTPLSMKTGVNHAALADFLNVLRVCKLQWAGCDFVPKRAASLFVDAYVTMMSLADLYTGAERDQVYLAADQVRDLIQDVLFS